ncbi:MAG TPA: MFS transporter [Ktedonobacteraceae bacterium]
MSTTNVEQPEKVASLWHNRDYLLLLSGQAISSTGTQLSQFAFPLLILALTGSFAWAGMASGVVLVPYFLLGLPAGALIDRWDRKRTMILCDAGRALTLASIPIALLLGHLTLIQLLTCALIEGTCYVFFDLAEVASIPRVVTSGQLPRAQSQKMSAVNAAITAGPLFGGTLFALGRALPFLADAISYAISVLSLSFIKRDFQAERTAPPQHLWVEICAGVSWLLHQKLIRVFALLSAVGSGIDNGILIFFIVVLSRQHASSVVIGFGYTFAGLAGITGAALAERVVQRLPLGRFTIIVQGTGLLLLALYFAAQQSIVGVIVITTMLSFLSALQGTVLWIYRAALIPDELQGRVNSVFRLIVYASPPLFMAFTGLLLQVSTTTTISVYTSIAGVVTLLILFNADVRTVPCYNRGADAGSTELLR